jgi:hypothetical protein
MIEPAVGQAVTVGVVLLPTVTLTVVVAEL